MMCRLKWLCCCDLTVTSDIENGNGCNVETCILILSLFFYIFSSLLLFVLMSMTTLPSSVSPSSSPCSSIVLFCSLHYFGPPNIAFPRFIIIAIGTERFKLLRKRLQNPTVFLLSFCCFYISVVLFHQWGDPWVNRLRVCFPSSSGIQIPEVIWSDYSTAILPNRFCRVSTSVYKDPSMATGYYYGKRYFQ